MPLGFQRLNERTQRPNPLINFIKPLEGPDKVIAQDFLNRLAAQCYPVMKANHISVMSLEEYEPNREFLGRNWNAGEVIELVLKDKSGHWLGFKYVQMVMMHELAHCKQMNHSRYFWQVRNQYAEQMHGLWAKKYSGEGIWGRGHDLNSGTFVMDRDLAISDVPEHLCGGTYRRRGRKRKRGAAEKDDQRPSYAERQQKRIAKKFGKHGDGNTLGENDLIRGALEQGHRHQGKPRVANSKRGRELRAQAALARFDAAKTADSSAISSIATDDESDVEWSDTDDENDLQATEDKGFVKVCGEEDERDEHAHQEMDELRAITTNKRKSNKTLAEQDRLPQSREGPRSPSLLASTKEPGCASTTTGSRYSIAQKDDRTNTAAKPEFEVTTPETLSATDLTQRLAPSALNDICDTSQQLASAEMRTCPICSLENSMGTLLCAVCAHVLRPKFVQGTWRCGSTECKSSGYLNAGGSGRCGICNRPKPVATFEKPTAAIGSDILRWD